MYKLSISSGLHNLTVFVPLIWTSKLSITSKWVHSLTSGEVMRSTLENWEEAGNKSGNFKDAANSGKLFLTSDGSYMKHQQNTHTLLLRMSMFSERFYVISITTLVPMAKPLNWTNCANKSQTTDLLWWGSRQQIISNTCAISPLPHTNQ